ncbi:hypothetical protein ELI_4103 [Eubacterium callanderi]|uniref:Uncharacterized protein n=1 Tax=Eubacterium callanderi TaxID=53442 RepID=E3GH90_9FIRM|nr:hypothetical protein ELI_4103 [Eubacterium callanderi]
MRCYGLNSPQKIKKHPTQILDFSLIRWVKLFKRLVFTIKKRKIK